MVSTGPVDGLISGMNTSQIIAQLMQIEAQPQTNLKNRVSQENAVIAAYQSVNSKMAALQTAAEAFTAPNSLTPINPTWQAVTATSSSTSVTATATTGATAGSYTFNVTSLAAAQVTTASFASSSSTAAAGSSISLTVGSTTTNINLTDTSVQGVANAINAAKTGVTAAVLTVNNPSGTGTSTVLQLTGSTGKANAFTISGLSASTTDITAAADATITVGNPTAGGYTVSSSTNAVTGAIPNVTLNVSQLATGVTVNVTADQNSIADKMQALVNAANDALSQISSQTSYNPTAKTGAPLTGDYTMRTMQSNILSAVSNGLNGYGSFSQFGVQLDSNGKLTFDRNAFLTAYSANPSAVQNAVATGLAKNLDTITKSATDPVSGTLTALIQSGNSQITDLNNQISDWDTRLQTRKLALQQQFAGLETTLGSLKDQSGWLAGQIAGLPTGGSGG